MAIQTARVKLNGAWYNAAYNGASGKWEVTLTAPGTTSFNLPGGYYPVELEATNTAGTTSTATTSDPVVGEALKFVVRETVKPTITITAPSEGAYLSVSAPEVTFQLRDEPGGSGVDISTLAVKVDTTVIAAADITKTAVANGYDCSFTAPALADGAHTVTVNISDNDGNAATQAARSFTVDTVPPVLDVTSPAQGLITSSAALTVSGTTNDVTSPSVTVTITLNGADQGAVTVGAGGAFSKAVTLVEGANTVVVTATDTAGRTSAITRDVTLDTTEPVFESVTIAPNPADAGATVIISVVIK